MQPTEASTAIVVRNVDAAELALKKTSADKAMSVLVALPCVTPEHEQKFADFLTFCRHQIGLLEQERKSRTDPLHIEKTRIDKLYKPTRDSWEAVEKLIRAKLQGAAQARLDAERKALAAATEASKARDVGAAVEALATIQPRPLVSGIGHGEEWEVAEHNLAQIPREWLTVDWSKVKIYLREHQNSPEVPPVPGFTFRRKAKVRAR